MKDMVTKMNVKEFYDRLTELYPLALRCSWDNDGIMCCADLNAPVRRVAAALDVTEASIDFAASEGCDVLLAHHPLLFRPVKSVVGDTVTGARLLRAMKAGVTVICLHTRLDAGNGGVNDILADMLGLLNTDSFGDDESQGLGRVGETARPYNLHEFSLFVKKALGAPTVTVTPSGKSKAIRRVAVVGGAGKDLIVPALLAGADTLVTGEIGYNARIDGAEMGLNLIEAGHFFTENPVTARLAELSKTIAGAETVYYSGDISDVI